MEGLPEVDDLKAWLQLINEWTGWSIPAPLLFILGVLALCALVLAFVYAVLFAIVQIKTLWLEKLLPKTYKAEQRGRANARRQFARYLTSEIERLNRSESWRDEEFTELEAEVEAQGRRRSWWPFHRGAGVSREASLSKALQRSVERLVLVQGDPGSGKKRVVAPRRAPCRFARRPIAARQFALAGICQSKGAEARPL